jgi:hypothetical protein
MFALMIPFGDPAPQPTEEVMVAEEGIVEEDGGTVEPMCCGPMEPPPLGGGDN